MLNDDVVDHWVDSFKRDNLIEGFLVRALNKLTKKNITLNSDEFRLDLFLVLSTYSRDNGLGEYLLFDGVLVSNPKISKLSIADEDNRISTTLLSAKTILTPMLAGRNRTTPKFTIDNHCQLSQVKYSLVNSTVDIYSRNINICLLGNLIHRETIPELIY